MGIHRLRKDGTVHLQEPGLFKRLNADVNDWLKGVTAFGRAKDQSMKIMIESAGVRKRALIQVYQTYHKSSLEETLLRIVPGKASTKSGPTEQFFEMWLNTDAAYIQKLVLSMPNPITAVFWAHVFF